MVSMAQKENIVKQGFLVKKGHLRTNWRTRWFELTNKDLHYYRKREDKAAAGTIDLLGATLAYPLPEDTKKPCLIQIKAGGHKEYLIQAPNREVREDWKTAIEKVMRSLDSLRIEKGSTPRFSGSVKYSLTSDSSKREIVQAMQDPVGGVSVREFKVKGSKKSTPYFTGEDLLDWLISWSFTNTRPSAIRVASSLLKHGYFNPVVLNFEKEVYSNLKYDDILGREFSDTSDACYIFVCFAPGENMDVFDSCSDDEMDSDSDEDLLATKTRSSSSIGNGDGKVLKQGFLRKKGHLRHNWKPRLFVLKDKRSHLYYYKGSKPTSKPLGTIPLRGLSVLELDNVGDSHMPILRSSSSLTTCTPTPYLASPTDTNGTTESSAGKAPKSPKSRSKLNRILLLTATAVRYELEAATPEDRDSWISEIKIASKLLL